METLSKLIDRRAPVSADAPCGEVLERFIREPDALTLAVLSGETPVGVIARDSFLVRMESPEAATLYARQVMEPDPYIAQADECPAAFYARAKAERPSVLLGGFVVVENGAYCGVGTAIALLGAGPAVQSPAPSAGQQTPLFDRMITEIRTPLEGMLIASERLAKLRLSDDASAFVDSMAETSRHIIGLMETAQRLQQVEMGLATFRTEPRRLQDLMDEVESRWRIRAEAAGVTLMASFDGEPDCSAELDAGQFHQIFDALIAHSLAHVRHGVIEASVIARSAPGGVAIEGRVRDNACALSPDYLTRLFDVTGAPADAGGLGVQLGLALAARYVQGLGGAISAEANMGAGATVVFSFAADAAVAAASTETAATETSRQAHILVVDDNATNRMVVEALCEMFDCSTESVTDGVEAVEAAKEGRFDVILMDIKMPRMDGVTATRAIRALGGAAGSAPIIALTANADPDEVREYLAAGMQTVVEKPIKPEKLLEALEMVLAAAETERAAAAA